MNNLEKAALSFAKNLQKEVSDLLLPPVEGSPSAAERVILFSLVKDTRSYVERTVHQINGSYEHGWYDACAVMIRRLIETLIIETFEAHQIADKIKNPNGHFLFLGDLINHTLGESSWNLARGTRSSLRNLKQVADQSAHSRRFIAHRQDIDKLKVDLRTAVQELLFLSKLKR